MVTIKGKLIDSRHVELSEPVPPDEGHIQVTLVDSRKPETTDAALLIRNLSFDFLREEPDLYE
jgi:hypothetical protein